MSTSSPRYAVVRLNDQLSDDARIALEQNWLPPESSYLDATCVPKGVLGELVSAGVVVQGGILFKDWRLTPIGRELRQWLMSDDEVTS